MKLSGLVVITALLALLAPAMAQETKKEEKPAVSVERPRDWVTKVIPIKREDMSSFVQLIKPLGVQVEMLGAFRSIGVTGPPEAVAAAEVLVKQYDVPVPAEATKNVELTSYLLVAEPQGAQQAGIPKELEGVVMQLRRLFAYQRYLLLDTLVVRSREGRGVVLTSLGPDLRTASTKQDPVTYTLNINSIGISPGEKISVIRLNSLHLWARVPVLVPTPEGVTTEYLTPELRTDIDIREGQKVVVGKAGFGGTGGALILVVTAKVVD